MTFSYPLNRKLKPKSNVGSRLHPVFSPVYDHNGVLDLEQTGEENIYEYIQSHAESCDINVLIARYQNGDPTALSQRQGTFFDATGMPHTYAEMLNAIISAETTFNQLPVDIRAKFGHSFEQFLSQMDSPDFSEKMGWPITSGDNNQSSETASTANSVDGGEQ